MVSSRVTIIDNVLCQPDTAIFCFVIKCEIQMIKFLIIRWMRVIWIYLISVLYSLVARRYSQNYSQNPQYWWYSRICSNILNLVWINAEQWWWDEESYLYFATLHKDNQQSFRGVSEKPLTAIFKVKYYNIHLLLVLFGKSASRCFILFANRLL